LIRQEYIQSLQATNEEEKPNSQEDQTSLNVHLPDSQSTTLTEVKTDCEVDDEEDPERPGIPGTNEETGPSILTHPSHRRGS